MDGKKGYTYPNPMILDQVRDNNITQGQLQEWTEHSHNASLKMGVEGLMFEPHPPNSKNLLIQLLKMFKLCVNDFLISLLVSDFKRWSVGVFRPFL